MFARSLFTLLTVVALIGLPITAKPLLPSATKAELVATNGNVSRFAPTQRAKRDTDADIVYVDVTSTVTTTVQPGNFQATTSVALGGAYAEQADGSGGAGGVAAIAIETDDAGQTVSTVAETMTASAVRGTATAVPPAFSSNDFGQQTWVNLHNSARRKYGAPDVEWNADLVALAKKNAELCNAKHTKGGENLQWGSNLGTPESAIDAWMSEDALYNWHSPGYQEAYGHFTQIVWKDTKRIGCWISKCPSGSGVNPDGTYEETFQTACEYEPAGNVVTRADNAGVDNFRANVGSATF
ncbi:hypothetical protein IAU60_006851 [Kwoniella sp. DSM 27419]